MRTTNKKINTTLFKQIKKTFAQAVADLKDVDEVNIFLNDFFTESEKEVFTKRLAISYWLIKKRSYSNIKNNLQVSSATISTVQNEIEKPGYKLILQKIEAEEWANKWSEKIKKYIK